LLLVASLTLGPGSSVPAAEPTLHVSAAISLRPALEEAFAGYASTAPDVRVVLNSGGSGVLLQQARRGAPVDLLISASSHEIEILVDEGLTLAGTRRSIASNRLVVVVPRDGAPPAALDDLLGARFERLAVANPKTAPLGRYTRQALEGAGIWSRLTPRPVTAENARQTLDYVARSEVDAAIVYATDARLLADRLQIGPTIHPELHDPIAYEGVVLAHTRRAAQATDLLDWLASARGREPLARHGFLAP
jgi:molybdate transport system substrate-binding protein